MHQSGSQLGKYRPLHEAGHVQTAHNACIFQGHSGSIRGSPDPNRKTRRILRMELRRGAGRTKERSQNDSGDNDDASGIGVLTAAVPIR